MDQQVIENIKKQYDLYYSDLSYFGVTPILDSLTLGNTDNLDGFEVVGNVRYDLTLETGARVISIDFTKYNVPELDDYITDLKYRAIEQSSIDRTLSIDYRLLKDATLMNILKNKCQKTHFILRIIGKDYYLTEEDYQLIADFPYVHVDNPGFSAPNVVNTKYPTTVSKPSSNYFQSSFNFFIDTNPSLEDLKEFITLNELSDSTIHPDWEVTINLRFYNIEEYNEVISKLSQAGLSNKAKINILGNPLKDNSSSFNTLSKYPYDINVLYHTCQDLIDYTTHEPYGSHVTYESELEGSGVVDLKGYIQVLEALERFAKLVKDNNYSPLEATISAYQFLQEEYTYNDDQNDADNDRILHNVIIDKSTIVCVGFATLFSAMLRKVGIKGFRYSTDVHARNICQIKDDKYDIDHIGIFDPTWDNLKNAGIKFGYFGLALTDSVKLSYKPDEPEMLNIPSACVVARNDYEANQMNSASPYERFWSSSYSPIHYVARMLELMGYEADWNTSYRQFDINKLYETLADLMARNVTSKPIPLEKILKAYEVVLRKEHPEYSEDRISYFLDIARLSHENERLVLDSKPKQLINLNFDKNTEKEVSLITPKIKENHINNPSTKEEYNHQLESFRNKHRLLLSKWYEYVINSLKKLKYEDFFHHQLYYDIGNHLNDYDSYPLLLIGEKVTISQIIDEELQKQVYNELSENLFNYLIILTQQIQQLESFPELQRLKSAPKEYYNTPEYLHDYNIVTNAINVLIDSASNSNCGVTITFTNDVLDINFANNKVSSYHNQILSDELLNTKYPKVIPTQYETPNEEPTFNTHPYVSSSLPQTKEDYITKYQEIINIINTKVSEVNNANAYYESIGMLSITDYQTIETIINNEQKVRGNILDIINYKYDLLNLKLNYLSTFKTPLTTNPELQINDFNYSSLMIDFLGYSKQIIYVAANEIISLYNSHNLEHLNLLFNLIDSINAIISHRLVYENTNIPSEDLQILTPEIINELRHIKNNLSNPKPLENISVTSNSTPYNYVEVTNKKLHLNPHKKVKTNTQNNLILEDSDKLTLTTIKNGLRIKLDEQTFQKLSSMKAKIALVSKMNYRSRTSVNVETDSFDLAFKKRDENFNLDDYKVEIRIPTTKNKTTSIYEYDLANEEMHGLRL